MTLTNFRAEDFVKGDSVKVARSKKDRFAAPQPTSTPVVAPNADPEDVPSGTVPEVLSWVGDDAVRAQKALDAELENEKPRKGLVSELSDKINVEADAADADEAEDDESDEK